MVKSIEKSSFLGDRGGRGQFGTSQFGTVRASSERPQASSERLCSEQALEVCGLTPRASSEHFFFHQDAMPLEGQKRA